MDNGPARMVADLVNFLQTSEQDQKTRVSNCMRSKHNALSSVNGVLGNTSNFEIWSFSELVWYVFDIEYTYRSLFISLKWQPLFL